MKIIFSNKEIKEALDMININTEGTKRVSQILLDLSDKEVKEMDEYTITMEDLKQMTDSKIVSMKFNRKGLNIDIKTEFVTDVLEIYDEIIKLSVPPILAIIKASMEMDKECNEFIERWL